MMVPRERDTHQNEIVPIRVQTSVRHIGLAVIANHLPAFQLQIPQLRSLVRTLYPAVLRRWMPVFYVNAHRRFACPVYRQVQA